MITIIIVMIMMMMMYFELFFQSVVLHQIALYFANPYRTLRYWSCALKNSYEKELAQQP